MKIGIIANEFGDPRYGRMGGFGWAARETARLFLARPNLGVQPVFLAGEPYLALGSDLPLEIHGVRLVPPPRSDTDAVRAEPEAVDLLLTIDWRPGYVVHTLERPRVPLVVWIRDPRGPQETERVRAIRVPGMPDRVPEGLAPIDCTSLAAVTKRSHEEGRRFALASPEPSLIARVSGAYGISNARLEMLPNPIALPTGSPAKRPVPTVAFLGRLDPVKRPWLVYALARRLRHVDFLVLGRPHFAGPGGWTPPSKCLENVHSLGYVDGEEKARLLAEAWLLVNTSAHEALPVSFLEALACETPLAAFVDTGGVVSRFGICAGPSSGTGEGELDSLHAAVVRLLEDEPLRARLGRLGRAWVERTHGIERFLASFARLCTELGVGR
jgi:glycosyltransferase involved in cell wall biosynthesis